jgi:shikimate kinase
MNHSIYLIGFMGSGKSTIGQEIARLLKCSWIDLDCYIEETQQMPIKDLFKQYGELYFRDLECAALEALSNRKNSIVSTGGGIIVTPKNAVFLKSQKTFYLKWEFETLFNRISQDQSRPLARSYEEVMHLYQSREMLYEAASWKVILGEGKSVEAIAKEIINSLEGVYENSSY